MPDSEYVIAEAKIKDLEGEKFFDNLDANQRIAFYFRVEKSYGWGKIKNILKLTVEQMVEYRDSTWFVESKKRWIAYRRERIIDDGMRDSNLDPKKAEVIQMLIAAEGIGTKKSDLTDVTTDALLRELQGAIERKSAFGIPGKDGAESDASVQVV